LQRDRYEVSMAIGEQVLLPRVRAAGEGTLIVADGYSCREQIRQSTRRVALHPAQVLALGLDEHGGGPAVDAAPATGREARHAVARM